MAVPKKKKSKSKRNHRHAVWKGKAAIAAQKAISLGKSVLTGKAQGFVYPIDEDEEELPQENFLMLELENGFTVAIRPSGTEPKIKYYLFGCGEKNALDLEKSKEEVSLKMNEISEWLVVDAKERTNEHS